MLPKAKRRYHEEGARTFNFDWPEQTEVRTRLRDFLEPAVDEKYYLSEDKTAALVAQLEQRGHMRETMPQSLNLVSRGAETRTDDMAYCLKGAEGGSSKPHLIEPKIAEEVRPVITPERLEKRQNGRRFKEDGEEAFTLTSIDRHGVAVGEYPKYRIRKLTPRECLRLQSVPEDVIDSLSTQFSDSRLYKFAGNGLTTNVITAIGERLIKYL